MSVARDDDPFDLIASLRRFADEAQLSDEEAALLVTDRTASMPRAADLGGGA